MTKVLLVTEALPHPNKGGASQTLFNIFKHFKKEDLCVYTPIPVEPQDTLQEPFRSNILFSPLGIRFRLPARLPFSTLLNKLIEKSDDFLKKHMPLAKSQKLKEFDPDIVLFCPLGSSVLGLVDKVNKVLRSPTLLYFMDDWPVGHEQVFDKKIKEVLENATGHIFISEYLKSTMQSRLGFQEKPFRIIHNPVDKKDICYSNMDIIQAGTFRIVYAGSLWGIQLDAVKQMAEAVGSLRKKGVDIIFTLYTLPAFYEQNRNFWVTNEVEYGGWISYLELKSHLRSADVLLVASSFLPMYKNLTLGSLQTKVTDYLATCRPVLCLGPSYSANNLFVKKWQCGLVFESDSSQELADFLKQLIPHRNLHKDLILNGLKQLEEKLNTEVVGKEVEDFLSVLTKEG
jgi:glycosyltransferase involved in cell wall biosynthesis